MSKSRNSCIKYAKNAKVPLVLPHGLRILHQQCANKDLFPKDPRSMMVKITNNYGYTLDTLKDLERQTHDVRMRLRYMAIRLVWEG